MPDLEPKIREIVSEKLASVIEPLPLPALGAGPSMKPLRDWLLAESESLNVLQRCGILLLAGELDASHEISQSVETPDGSFWHGIMHRREGDFWNAKYWFRRVGKHPVLAHLETTPYGDAQAFVDRCESAIAAGIDEALRCQELQWQEWQWLYAHVTGKP